MIHKKEHHTSMVQGKSPKQLERHLKGIANHWRIRLLLLVAEREGISLLEIVESTKGNEKTIGEHMRRLVYAGLITKTYKGQYVAHMLSPYGRVSVDFLKKFGSM